MRNDGNPPEDVYLFMEKHENSCVQSFDLLCILLNPL